MVFFFVKQQAAYEMRSSDWSSDVCSSDLLLKRPDVSYHDLSTLSKENGEMALSNPLQQGDLVSQLEIEVKYAGYVLRQQAEVERGAGNESIRQIGSVSCRERVCQFV